MVGHGVRTAKGCKRGKVKSLFIRQNTGKFEGFSRFYGIFEFVSKVFLLGAICISI